MTPLPAILSGNSENLIAWRIENERYFLDWQLGEGAFRVGGRWSSPGKRVIYASLDPATAILEVVVHKGINAIDETASKLLELEVVPADVHVVQPEDVPNPNWLIPGSVSPNQQKFGDGLLEKFPLIVVPSVVSKHSWNLIIEVSKGIELVKLKSSDRFGLDTRMTNPG